MIKTEFMALYEELSEIQEARTNRPFPQGYVEAAESINLGDCRMIASDVVDTRGELEESACLDYKGVLTRVAASVLPFRDGPEGKEIFLKLWRSAVYLLGGGVDITKDGTDPTKTVARESFEECNMNLSNIKDSGCSYWEYSEKPWVERHVANPEDRWDGYYTWLFTADYTGEGDNEFPEEGDNFRWHRVSDILARPDTKKLKFIKQAIIQGGYAEAPALEEDIALTEGKQLGYVSYAVRKSSGSPGHPISSLVKILNSGYIKASTEEDGSKYVSLSRDLLGHLGAGSDWKCGMILDGDKLANRYKVKPVNYNSMVYFGNSISAKQLMLRYIAKYQALDGQGQVTDRAFWVVSMQGSSFLNEISEATYEVLKTLMNEYNSQLAVSETGKASDKYKGKTNQEVKKYFDVRHTGSLPHGQDKPDWQKFRSNPDNNIPQWLRNTDSKPALVATGSVMQPSRVPKKYADAPWRCTECIGYNSPTSGLILKASRLDQYKDLIISAQGVDITSHKFFSAIGGKYADEAEERIEAQLIKLVNKYGETTGEAIEDFGMDITGCIKAILIDDKHRAAFRDFTEDELKSRKVLWLYKDGLKTSQVDNTPGIRELALDIRHFAKQNNIPIVLFIPGVTTNSDVLDEIRGLPPKRMRLNIMKMQQAQKQELPEGLEEAVRVISDPDVLYHATEVGPFYDILNSGVMLHDVRNEGGVHAICFTTDDNYSIYGYPCKIKFSRSKLEQGGYELYPVDEFEDYGEGESEERIDEDINDVRKYVTEVIVDWEFIAIAQDGDDCRLSTGEYDDEGNESDNWDLKLSEFRALLDSLKASGIKVIEKGQPNINDEYWFDETGEFKYGREPAFV